MNTEKIILISFYNLKCPFICQMQNGTRHKYQMYPLLLSSYILFLRTLETTVQ